MEEEKLVEQLKQPLAKACLPSMAAIGIIGPAVVASGIKGGGIGAAVGPLGMFAGAIVGVLVGLQVCPAISDKVIDKLMDGGSFDEEETEGIFNFLGEKSHIEDREALGKVFVKLKLHGPEYASYARDESFHSQIKPLPYCIRMLSI